MTYWQAVYWHLWGSRLKVGGTWMGYRHNSVLCICKWGSLSFNRQLFAVRPFGQNPWGQKGFPKCFNITKYICTGTWLVRQPCPSLAACLLLWGVFRKCKGIIPFTAEFPGFYAGMNKDHSVWNWPPIACQSICLTPQARAVIGGPCTHTPFLPTKQPICPPSRDSALILGPEHLETHL